MCIGNEILLNPSLLFLDEPTSGLDSTTALRIGQILQNIAKVLKVCSDKTTSVSGEDYICTDLVLFHRVARPW